MNVLIVAQNLFVARMLVSLAESHKSVSSYKVIVFSSIEKTILSKFNGVSTLNIISPSDISRRYQLDTHIECIEVKRGMFSTDSAKRLQSYLSGMIESQAMLDFQYIWIFNEHTFIGSFLKKSQNYAKKCIVFENSNINKGVTIIGDIFGQSGEYLRNLFLNPNKRLKNSSRSRYNKFYRIITFPFHIRSPSTFYYYFKRFFIRLFNMSIFFLSKHVNKVLNSVKKDHAIILVVLQIKDDSSVAMNVDFNEYCKLIISAAIELQADNPETKILVRPHPLDYTLGWLTFIINLMKQSKQGLNIDFSDIEDLYSKNISHLITYNSNIRRHELFSNGTIKCIYLGPSVVLPLFIEDLPQLDQVL